MFSHLKIRTRLWLLVASAMLGCALFATFSAISSRNSMLENHRQRVEHLVNTATGIVEHYRALEQSGQMDQQAAQQAAIAALRDIRFGEAKDYYFIYGPEAVALMVPAKPELEGKSMLGNKDSNGFKLWDRIDEIGKSGTAAFITYYFPRVGSTVSYPKLSYMQPIPAWKWVIGTGVYVDDVDQKFYADLWQMFIILSAITVLVLLLSQWVVRSVVRELGGEPVQAAGVMREVATGQLNIVMGDNPHPIQC